MSSTRSRSIGPTLQIQEQDSPYQGVEKEENLVEWWHPFLYVKKTDRMVAIAFRDLQEDRQDRYKTEVLLYGLIILSNATSWRMKHTRTGNF